MLGFYIHRNQQHRALTGKVKIDHPCTTTLTTARCCPAYLTRTVRAGNHIASQRIACNPVNKRIALSFCPNAGCLLLEFLGFDHGEHYLIVEPNNIYSQELFGSTFDTRATNGYPSQVAPFWAAGFSSPDSMAHSRAIHRGFFVCEAWQVLWAGHAGGGNTCRPIDRPTNPHGLPTPFSSGRAGYNRFLWSLAMSQSVSASALVVFNFDSNSVRVILRGNEPWFVASDVCVALTISDTSMAVSRLDDDERGTSIIGTPSGEQQMLIINESGLYSLILTSRKPEAKKFKKWVTSEVLPEIRKTGRYEAPTPYPNPNILTPNQHNDLMQSIHFALAGVDNDSVEENNSQWVTNRLRVRCNIASIQAMRPDQLALALAELDQLKQDLKAYFEFRAEIREMLKKEIIGAGTPWTPTISQQWRAKFKTCVPANPEWLVMQRQLAVGTVSVEK
ncbi:hypothetical protein CCP4SC76_5810003 [Gammaproteobacteria bacterium]